MPGDPLAKDRIDSSSSFMSKPHRRHLGQGCHLDRFPNAGKALECLSKSRDNVEKSLAIHELAVISGEWFLSSR